MAVTQRARLFGALAAVLLALFEGGCGSAASQSVTLPPADSILFGSAVSALKGSFGDRLIVNPEPVGKETPDVDHFDPNLPQLRRADSVVVPARKRVLSRLGVRTGDARSRPACQGNKVPWEYRKTRDCPESLLVYVDVSVPGEGDGERPSATRPPSPPQIDTAGAKAYVRVVVTTMHSRGAFATGQDVVFRRSGTEWRVIAMIERYILE
jgi:sugar/nucleoside kinase (ribokinase family)